LAYQNSINSKIIPTYRKLADYLKCVFAKARATSGYNVLPNGTQCTTSRRTTTKTPDEIYQTGLREVEQLLKIDALQIKKGSGTEKRFQSCIDRSLLFLSLLMNKYWKVTEQYKNRT
jgi:uncharacterized protein (DUF885 family)